MKLTADLILHSSQYLNALNEFHIDLRGKVNITVGYKIPYIENLAATNDQFSCVDLTDNEITSLSELPPLKRIRSLLLSNNRITRVDPTYGKCTPYLENLILTNNKINSFAEIENLAKCSTIIRLSLIDNPVTQMKNYRLFTIYAMKNLRVLDFQKVKKRERVEAEKIFKTEPVQPIEPIEPIAPVAPIIPAI